MYCWNCGTELRDSARFCKECGSSVGGNETTRRSETAPAGSPSILPIFDEESLSKRRLAIVGGGVILVGIVVAAQFFADSDVNSTNQAPTVPAETREAPSAPKEAGAEPPSVRTAAAEAPAAQEKQAEAEETPRAGGRTISGTITVAPTVDAPSGGSLFVMGRLANNSLIAVARIPPSGKATPFTLGQTNMMIAGSFDQPLRIHVRWDQDGEAVSKTPGDITGSSIEAVRPGAKGVSIVLDTVLGETP